MSRDVEARRAAEAICRHRVQIRCVGWVAGCRSIWRERARRAVERRIGRPSRRRRGAGTAVGAIRRSQQVRPDESVEIPVKHAVDITHLVIGAVILDHRVRVQDVGADLGAEVDVLRLSLFPRDLLAALALLEFHQLRAQHRHRLGLVGGLRALVLALDDDPLGRCVIRTAESVLLTCCPPAPGSVGVDLQVVLIDLHLPMSSTTGETSTPAKLVWRRLAESNGDRRTSRCTPFSLPYSPYAFSPLTRNVADFMPGLLSGDTSSSSTAKPRFSAQRISIRRTISAQSWASVPPAPALTVTSASPAS